MPSDTSDVFAGAAAADGYVEPEHTIRGARPGRAPATVTAAPMQPAPLPPMPPARPVHEPARIDLTDGYAALQQPIVSATRAIATRGFRGVLARLGIPVAPGVLERAELENTAAEERHQDIIRQGTWVRPVGILVANPKGGVGKTPLALLLGGVLAQIRGGFVAVVEVSDDAGGLYFRAEGTPATGLGELVRDVTTIQNAGHLGGYVAAQTSRADVIGSAQSRAPLTAADVSALANVIDRYYRIRVMDSGNQSSSSAFLAAAALADVLVIPTLNAADSMLEAIELVRFLRAAPHTADLANRAILVRLEDGRPEHPQILERIERLVDGAGLWRAHSIPYDPHIAERGPLTLAQLAPLTRRAITELAASVVEATNTSAAVAQRA